MECYGEAFNQFEVARHKWTRATLFLCPQASSTDRHRHHSRNPNFKEETEKCLCLREMKRSRRKNMLHRWGERAKTKSNTKNRKQLFRRTDLSITSPNHWKPKHSFNKENFADINKSWSQLIWESKGCYAPDVPKCYYMSATGSEWSSNDPSWIKRWRSFLPLPLDKIYLIDTLIVLMKLWRIKDLFILEKDITAEKEFWHWA